MMYRVYANVMGSFGILSLFNNMKLNQAGKKKVSYFFKAAREQRECSALQLGHQKNSKKASFGVLSA